MCPPAENKTVRVAFTRPDYTYIDRIVPTDPETGNFSVTQKLDMIGYWNIFPIDGHIADRLFAEVTDPANPNAPTPTPSIPSTYKPVYNVIYVCVALLTVGGVACFSWNKKQNKKNQFASSVSSNRFNVSNFLRHIHRSLGIFGAWGGACSSRN